MRALARNGVHACAVAAICIAAAARVQAQYTEPPPPAAYALRDVTLVTADGTTRGVTVVIRGDFIEAVGRNVNVPADARVLTGDSLYVYPGLIDLHADVKHAMPRDSIDRTVVKAWAPTRPAQGFLAHRRIADHLTARGADVAELRKKGIVAAAVHPTDGLIPGQSAALLLRRSAGSPAEMVLAPSLGPVFALRGRQGFYPNTTMGVFAFYRQTFLDAARRTQLAQAAQNGAAGVAIPAFDPDYAIIQQVDGGVLPVWFMANTNPQIAQALTLSNELRFRPIIVGGAEAWRHAEALRARDIPVLVSVNFQKPRQWKPDAQSDTSDTPPLPGAERERIALEAEYANAGKLAAAGVRFALTSGGGSELWAGVRKAIEHGLSEQAALRALTTTPAELLGYPGLVAVQAGAPANLVVSQGPLFAEKSKVRFTFVEGELEEQAAGAASAARASSSDSAAAQLAGEWALDVQSPAGNQTSTLTLTQNGNDLTGTIVSATYGTVPVSGTVNGKEISLAFTITAGGQAIRLEMTGTADGDAISGTGTSPIGNFEWSGRRAAPGTEVR